MDEATTPVLSPPAGTMSNFDNPPSQKHTLIIVNAISLSVMLIFSALQYLGARRRPASPNHLEDSKR